MFNYSPLRYPGGKSRIAGFIAQIIKDNHLTGGNYVEPFAGGSGIALHLLLNNIVNNIYINDKDIAIYAFWKSILDHTDEFVKKIRETEISIHEWEKQKQIQQNKENLPIFDVGFSTFFLNRTNRSGIIKGGVIGGKKQLGKWKLDVRFNKEKLIEKILKIAAYKECITVKNKDVIDFLKEDVSLLENEKTFIYLDPPYYKQGQKLYLNAFDNYQHIELYNELSSLPYLWLVSYDDCEEIREIYKQKRNISYKLRYTACIKYLGKETMFASDNLIVEEDINPLEYKKAI